jgi:murein DD-endopeptidase MepM/ murein hydrolase activator NlpD
MKRRTFKKILTMLLTFAMVMSIMGMGVVSDAPTTADIPPANSDSFIEGTSMRMSEIPEVISLDTVRENDHIARLYELESDLHSVVFRNADDTNTMYMFGSPVQFIAEDGSVRDKSNHLHRMESTDSFSRTYAYVNRDNDIRTYFPHTLDRRTGILLTDGTFRIERSPITANIARVANRSRSVEDNWVYYDGIFGRRTALRYTPTFEGFKEEVVLYENVGINRFSFVVRTNGLALVYDGGAYSLVDPVTRETAGNIGEIIVYDSSGNMRCLVSDYRHFYKTEVIAANEEYLITIVVDERFLADAVYPVFVDPTTTLGGPAAAALMYGGQKQIQDATIVQGMSTTHGTGATITAGRHGLRTTRTLIQFPGLQRNSAIRHIPSSQITNATLTLTTQSATTVSTTVHAFFFVGLADWNENTVTGADAGVWSYSGQSFFSRAISVGAAHREFTWIITSHVQHWNLHQINNLLRRGIVLVNSSETDEARSVAFHATEATTASRRPRLSITWSGFTYVFAGTSPPRTVGSRYGDRPPTTNGTTEHKGVDITASRHTPLLSMGSGNVVFAVNTGSALGRYVVIELDARHPLTGQRLMVGYAHLESISVSATNRPRINAGSEIGTVGNSGTRDVHLHLQVMTDGNTHADGNSYRNTVNPLQYFPLIAFSFPNNSTPNDRYSWTHRRCRVDKDDTSSAVNYVPHPPITARCPTCNLANP